MCSVVCGVTSSPAVAVLRTGRPSGQADAIFSSERDARRVVSQMHKRDMGARYIECFMEEDD